MFVSGKVKIVMKTGDVIEGEVLPYEDIQLLSDNVPDEFLFLAEHLKDLGLFVAHGDTVSFLNKDDIKTMTALKFA